MSKRNFILLIIVLSVVVLAVFGFLYFRGGVNTGGDIGGTNFISQFNPFGTGGKKPPATTPPVDVSGYQPNSSEDASIKLKKVSSMPIAGFGLFQKEILKEIPPETITPIAPPVTTNKKTVKKPILPPTEFVGAVRYVERATGNIYQTFTDKIDEKKFSQTIIPKVHDAYFGNNAQSVVMRYLKLDQRTIETFLGTLPKEVLGAETTPNNEIKGSFLPENVQDASISPDTSKVFYLFSSKDSSGDNIVGIILNFLDGRRIQVFNSPFTEWLSGWPNDKMITLTTKPAASALGYMYGIDSSGRNLSKIVGDVNGLTTLASPSGKSVLVSNSNLSLSIYNTITRESVTLSVRTLPEKCVWGKLSDVVYCAVPKSISAGDYPETWYQGEVSFSDQIWKINIKNGSATMIADPVTIAGGEDIDGIKLSLNQDENYLFFVNKKDSFLWELNLK